MSDGKPLSSSVQVNVLHQGDSKTDPEYLKKKEFFDKLRVRGRLQMNPM